ncbi:MAG: glycosyltransferase family 2 protein [bacterium]|nr:glycosyltransferase [Candidatus Binatota bacterium]
MPTSTPPSVRTRPSDPLFSVVVPVFNEEACVAELVSRVRDAFEGLRLELILVNDGSSDHTLEMLQKESESSAEVHYLSFSRNFGHQPALAAGIEHATGDAVISLDGDLQHPPELIPQLIEHWREGYDIVYTVRVANEGHRLKEFVSRSFYQLLRRISGVDISPGTADFRLLDRRAADALKSCAEHFIFIRGMVPWLGFSKLPVPYEAQPRHGGETKYLTGSMIRFALDGIFAFSTVPLRLISLLGALTVCLGFLYGLYTLGVRLFTSQAEVGWTSLVVVILIFSGAQMLSIGILSEYVGRIYEEVKSRPRYVIAEASPAMENHP